MKIHQSAEDYLEKILMIREKKGEVHSIDIANELGFSKPSVSVAMKNLRQAGYISMDGSGAITLEAPGLEIAERIYRRHKLLTRFLLALGVSAETAARDACRIEHDLSPETFDRLQAYVEEHLPES
ncbi:MAG TPA: metal-dependent transcriptional regulator [Candidatus Gemmiger stercoripullorum]|nr:metal-dependent transcriptional regulator [Candidatus Gemmiger stercoripullorum]